MALGAMSKLHQSDLKVPEDISIIGFDDIAFASQIIPPLTTISAPVEELVARSFNMLKCLMEGKVLENKHIALAAELVVRKTSAGGARQREYA